MLICAGPLTRLRALCVVGVLLLAGALAQTSHTPLYAYSAIWQAGLKCSVEGKCEVDPATGYYDTQEAVKRQDESVKPQLSPIVDLSVIVLSSRLCMVVTGSPQHTQALALANHIDYGWQQRDLFNQVCTNVIPLEVNQRYNINASHTSNQNDPLGLSRTEDGLWGPGGDLYRYEYTQYMLDGGNSDWESYKAKYQAASTRTISIKPFHAGRLFFFSASRPGHLLDGTPPHIAAYFDVVDPQLAATGVATQVGIPSDTYTRR
jgi:hypothetical protein